ncbi:MAG TPA: TonB-dependent receptor, partial [Polyangiaceae bacterium]
GLQRLDSNAEFRPNSVLTHQSRESLYNVWSNLRHQNAWTKAVSSELNIGYSAGQPTRDDRFFLQGVLDRTYTRNYGYRAFSAAAAVDVTPIPQFSARLGLEAELELHDILFYTVTYSAAQGMREAGESVDEVPESVDTTQTVSNRAAYLTLSGQPLPMFEALRLTGSVRLDSTAYGDTDLDSMFSARAAAVVEVFPWLVTKLSYGRGYGVPSAVQMFAQTGFGISNILTGNLAAPSGAPAMTPQRVDSFEAGVHLAVWDAAVLQLTAFHQKVTGRIEFAWNGTSNFIGRNTEDQTLLGGEAVFLATLGPVNPFVSAALVKTEEEPLVAYPGFVGALGVDVALFSRPSLYFNGRVQHVGARAATRPHVVLNGGDGYELPAYQTVDLSLSLDELPLFGRELNTQVVASARNVFDQRHSEPGFVGFDVPALGRTAFIEVRQSF